MRIDRSVRTLANATRYEVRRVWYRVGRTFEIEEYRPDVDPLRRVRTDPSEIVHYTGRVGRDEVTQVREDIGTVQGGDWDRSSGRNIAPHLPRELTDLLFAERIEETELYRSLRDRFVRNERWEETGYYDVLSRLIEDGHEWHGCTNGDELHDRLEQLDAVYESMRKEGYRTQRELHRHPDPLTELSREVVVDRARDGDPLLVCGRHRLSMTKLLGLDEIPVAVCAYHRRWADPQYDPPRADRPNRPSTGAVEQRRSRRPTER